MTQIDKQDVLSIQSHKARTTFNRQMKLGHIFEMSILHFAIFIFSLKNFLQQKSNLHFEAIYAHV